MSSREEVDKFIEEIIEVCKKHDMSISHEDFEGGFEIEPYSEYNINWLKEASNETEAF